MSSLAPALWGTQCCGVTSGEKTHVPRLFGSDHPFRLHLILRAFCTLQNKIGPAESTADLTILEISITQIDGFLLCIIHMFQYSIPLQEAPGRWYYLLLEELVQQLL